MGYLPQFKNDIFISYWHVSNEGPDKWVKEFRDLLHVRPTELVDDIKIWCDEQDNRAGDQWRPEIAEASTAWRSLLPSFREPTLIRTCG